MDYRKLGLRIGLEIHQQLASRCKLFCRCPIPDKEQEFPLKVKRHLRVVAGEMGDYDPAAVYEYLKKKTFYYNFNQDTSCLVELDEDPPKEMNVDALKTALQACRLLKCKIVDEIHVMRKTVIDGSSVSGFQRTALIGMNGVLETPSGEIKINTVCLEEDSAPAIKKEDDIVHYRLDRLGIPLIEITTDSSIYSPKAAKEVAETIGMLLRSLDVVRGIGSIRQDVNISIENGARVEIKGFQDLPKMPEMIENEIKRQVSLILIKEELEKKGIEPDIKGPIELTHVFAKTKNRMIKQCLIEGGKVLVLVVRSLRGLFQKNLGCHTLGKEISFYAGAYGYGIMHSDEDLEKYELTNEFRKIAEETGSGSNDLIIISFGASPKNAMLLVKKRIEQLFKGVPEETRVSMGTDSVYTRPLPGSARMYPESDIKPIKTEDYLSSLPEVRTFFEKKKELERIMPKELANQIIKSRFYPFFEEMRQKFDIDPVFIANLFVSVLKDIKRKGFDIDKIKNQDIEFMLKAIQDKKIAKSSAQAFLEDLANGLPKQELLKKYSQLSEAEIKKIVFDIVKKNPDKTKGALMGMIMNKLRGKADGKTVSEILEQFIKE